MIIRSIITTFAIASTMMIATPGAIAQAMEYDEVFPFGAGITMSQNGMIKAPSEYSTKRLRGEVYYEPYSGYVYAPKIRHHHWWHSSNDTVYGRVLQIQPGLGAPFLY